MLLTISTKSVGLGSVSIPFKPLLLSLFMLAAPSLVLAEAKRVTIPIALPFQQAPAAPEAASAAASSAPPVATHQLKVTQFTQRPASASAASSQSAAPAQPVKPTQPVAATSAAAASKPTAKPAVQQAQAKAATPATQAKPAPEARQVAAKIPVITTGPISAVNHGVGHPDAFVAEFERYVEQKIAPFVPGVAIVVVSGGQVKSLQGYGVRRSGTREKVSPDTVFRLASLSKPVAATAASVLVNEGAISWDTSIVSVLPKVGFKNTRYGNQLTLRHALSQSSGLPRHTYSHYIDQNMNYNDVVGRLRYVNFVCPPGKCYAYQNVVYSLAGDMIKARAGMSFESYVDKKLFAPLGMRSASFGLLSYNASPNRAAPHIASGNRWIPTSVVENWYKVPPAAGVNASIVDMSQFLLGQIGRRPEVLPLEVLKPIQARVTINTPEQNYYGVRKAVGNTAYGLGWRVFDYGRNKNFIHHGGHVKGFRSEMVFNRELQIGMVFLTNSETRLARDVIFKFLDMHERSQQAARSAKKH